VALEDEGIIVASCLAASEALEQHVLFLLAGWLAGWLAVNSA
jgi:hypothetical protein